MAPTERRLGLGVLGPSEASKGPARRPGLGVLGPSRSLDEPQQPPHSDSWASGLCRTLSDFRGRKSGLVTSRRLGEEEVRRSKRELKGEEPRYLVRTGSLRTKKILDSPAPSPRSEGRGKKGGCTEGMEGGSRDAGDTLRKKKEGETCYMLQTGCYVWTGRTYHTNSYILQRRERTQEKPKSQEEKKEDAYRRPYVDMRERQSDLIQIDSTKERRTFPQHSQTVQSPCWKEGDVGGKSTAPRSRDDIPDRPRLSTRNPNCDNGGRSQHLERRKKEISKRAEEEELVQRLVEKVDSLEQRLLEMQGNVGESDREGREQGERLGGREGERLQLQGRELTTVTLLLLALSRRLARLEVLDVGEVESSVERKRERLQLQLGEARQLRRSIARRSLKIERDLEEVLGAAAVATYQAWVQERELWVTKERQAQERLQLAREELARLRRGLAGQEV